jgi:hypothetical protein
VETVSNSTSTNADKAKAKNIFKKIARQYMRTHKPPSERELEPLSELREEFTWYDIISWRDEVGLRRGVVYDDGAVTFIEWPQPPHERIIGEITKMFLTQMIIPWDNTADGPTFYTTGSEGNKSNPNPQTLPSISKRNLISQISIIQANVNSLINRLSPVPARTHKTPPSQPSCDCSRYSDEDGQPLSSKSVTPSPSGT